MLQLPMAYSRPVRASAGLFGAHAATSAGAATQATATASVGIGVGTDDHRPETASADFAGGGGGGASLHKHGTLSPLHPRGMSPGPTHYRHPPASPLSGM